MRRRAKTGSNAVKTKRRKTLSRRSAPKGAHNRGSSAAGQARLARELREAREQQTATSEVLGVISSSPGELGPVFEAILENATRICGGRLANLFLYSKREHAFRLAAQRNAPAAYAERWVKNPVLRIGENPRNPLERLAKTRRVVAIPDLMVEPGYINRDPRFVALVEGAGARTHVLIPMLKEGELIGGIAVYRQEVLPFTDRQIELLRNFAAQAVIAIENTRLLNELRESLQQQTATADVLKVISSSPGELEPVFQEMLSNAMRICDAKFGILFEFADGVFRALSSFNLPPAFAEFHKEARVWGPDSGLGRLASTKKTIHVKDTQEGRAFAERDAGRMAAVELGGVRTFVAVPMLKENELVGAFVIFRQEVRPFTDKQIELVSNFAAQAVIALENARLLNELRESLQQQTATADVLKTISRSTFDLNTVLYALAESAKRLCISDQAYFYLLEGKSYRLAASCGFSPQAEALLKQHTIVPGRNTLVARTSLEGRVIHIEDVLADPEYTYSEAQKLIGFRTGLGVPLLREGTPIGVMTLSRCTVQPFTQKQIDLVSTFADQAVIAIENVRLFDEVQARTRELSESLEQQTATSEVLKVISSSPGDLEPVFHAMLENATRVCEAKFGILFRHEAGLFHTAAMLDVPPAFSEFMEKQGAFPPKPGLIFGRLCESKSAVSIVDRAAEPDVSPAARLGGARSAIAVPMLKDGELVGAFFIYRTEVRPFTEKQIALVTNFAAQAVIAIENARLLTELRESLERQTATADVLTVISSSPGTLDPVFSTVLAKASELCGASYGTLWLHEGDGFRTVAMHGDLPPAWVEQWRSGALYRPGLDRPLARAAEGRQPIQVADMRDDPSYLQGDPLPVSAVEIAGIRTLLVVPMFKESDVVGAIAIYRKEVLPFTEKQIELVKNFAAQAVIAIENTRLLNELRESLQRQTATSEVLQVISSSPGELQPVFETILENAVRICGAKFGNLWLRDGNAFRIGATHGAPDTYVAYLRREQRFRPDPKFGLGRVLRTKEPYHVDDIAAQPTHADPLRKATIELAGARTLAGVPMLKDNEVIGCIVIYRQEVRPFTDKQIALVKNFAAQAVIAIENTRLLSELRESLQQQTATADVLKVISSSPGELEPVFKAMLENAVHICEAKFGHMFLSEGDAFRVVALESGTLPYPDWLREGSKLELRENPQGPLAQIAGTGKIVHIGDLTAEAPYRERNPRMVALVESSGARTFLGVPMFRGETLMGAIGIYRQEVRPFTEKQVALVQNFAAQAVIAIENARLLNELRQRTHELATSLDDLRNTQDRLVQTQKLASLGQLTAGIAHEIKNPLNFVNNFSGISAELITELQEALLDVNANEKKRGEITELMDTLRGNLDKIVQHGKRADAIVKNMLLHSREGSGEHRLVDINALVEESLNLAYHGARAEKQGFNITLQRSFDPMAGEADLFPQEITRALLNFISNGFYAATKRRAEANSGDYEPVIAAATKNLGAHVEITIRDNGTGIPLDVKEKMFNPFFTTKPTGEGTGLGLSISHDIIVKQHGGFIEVDTQPGEFTEIRVVLPRVVALLPERS